MNAALVAAIRLEEPSAKEAYGQQTRDEWALSRAAEGWSPALVNVAVGAGALSEVRGAIRSERFSGPPRFHRAVRALAIIDSGRSLETVYPSVNALCHRRDAETSTAARSTIRRR